MRGVPVQTLGLSVNGCSTRFASCGACPLFEAQSADAEPGQPAGLPGDPGRKRSMSFFVSAGKPQTVIFALARGISCVMPATVMRRP